MTLQLEVAVPAATGESDVELAVNAALDETETADKWAHDWVVGAAFIVSVRRGDAAEDDLPDWLVTGVSRQSVLTNIDGLNDLVRDMFQSFPDTADADEWRDRAGALGVRDPDGQPYRAHTEEDT